MNKYKNLEKQIQQLILKQKALEDIQEASEKLIRELFNTTSIQSSSIETIFKALKYIFKKVK